MFILLVEKILYSLIILVYFIIETQEIKVVLSIKDHILFSFWNTDFRALYIKPLVLLMAYKNVSLSMIIILDITQHITTIKMYDS